MSDQGRSNKGKWDKKPMISVIIPTFNSEIALAQTLAALVSAAADGVVREVIVVDAGSSDHTHKVADAAGCEWRE